MKTLLLVSLLTIIAPADITRDTELTSNIISFNNQWNSFIREYFGCNKEVYKLSECAQNSGVINYEAWIKARKRAKQLFDFKD